VLVVTKVFLCALAVEKFRRPLAPRCAFGVGPGVGCVDFGEPNVAALIIEALCGAACFSVTADETPTAEPDTVATARPAASATRCWRTLAPLRRTREASAESRWGTGSAIGARSSATSEYSASGYSTTSSDTANSTRHKSALGELIRRALAPGGAILLAQGA
jgi:hypothetical protein